MFVPVYQWLSNSSAITALVGTRIYAGGVAPSDAADVYPYIVFQAIGMAPESFIGSPQDLDYDRVRIAFWSRDQAEAKQLAITAREVLSEHAEIVGAIIEDKDVETGAYRFGFDIGDWTEL